MSELSTESTPLWTGSNLLVRAVDSAKTEIRAPQDGYLSCDRNEFADVAELAEWLSRAFSVSPHEQGVRGSVRRVGKYRRRNPQGDPCFTFGDPVLDLITDENGVMVLGGRPHDLRRHELAASDVRGGGISTIDLGPFADRLRQSQIVDAAMGRNNLTLVECAPDRVVIASSNPSTVWNYDPADTSKKMRFRAFKKSYIVYQKLGADIETWGRDFSSATINSSYGVFLGDFCQSVKQDSDSDTDDDYVDEYEWAVGVPATTPDGVRSRCTARWGGRAYSETVEKGCVVVDI